MTTQKERELMAEIIDLAIEVNKAGKVCAHVELGPASLTMRIRPETISEAEEWEWIYYPDRPAYFESEHFDARYFEAQAAEFITELKKHHPQYDADGVRL